MFLRSNAYSCIHSHARIFAYWLAFSLAYSLAYWLAYSLADAFCAHVWPDSWQYCAHIHLQLPARLHNTSPRQQLIIYFVALSTTTTTTKATTTATTTTTTRSFPLVCVHQHAVTTFAYLFVMLCMLFTKRVNKLLLKLTHSPVKYCNQYLTQITHTHTHTRCLAGHR